MGWINFDDVLGQMQAFGLDVEAGDIEIGQRRRCRHKDGGREKRGWFQLYELPKTDGSGLLIVGSFGAFWGAENVVQKVELPTKERKAMSSEQLEALKARIAADKKKAEAEAARVAEECARRADFAWRSKCQEGSRDQSAYLKRKQIEPHGGRFLPGGKFCIPLQDTERRTYGLQIIYDEKKNGRDKSFWPAGLAKKGHFFLIGGIPDRLLLVAEGFATAASIHQATKLPVAVAFDAGNLLPVVKALKAKYKRAKFLICADDDYRTEGNPGVTHARNAALAVEGSVVFPVFTEERPTDTKGPTDFNDLHLLEGEQAVARQIEAALSELGWAATRAARGNSEQPGGGGKDFPTAVSVMDLDDAVDRFIPIDDDQGEALFDNWTYSIVNRKKMGHLLAAGIRSDDVKRHPVWIQRGAVYLHEIGFDPAGADKYIKLNTWRGWPMQPKKGSCLMLLDLLRYLCSAESNAEEVYEWILGRLAYNVQFPGKKIPSAIIMHGPQGTGKSTFFRAYAQIFGDEHPTKNYSVILDQKALQDNFNADWENKLFVLCEEVVNGSDKWQLKNELKELVTGSTIRIRKVYKDGYPQKNRLFLVFLSNEFQPLPLDNDDRRHLVVWTPPKGSYEFYDEVREEIANGGIEALYDYLLNYDMSRFSPSAHPPMTGSKQRLISLSASSDIRFCNEWIIGDLDFPVVPCLATDFYAAYLKWCRANGESRPRPSNQFFGAVAHQQGWEKKKARIYPQETSLQTEPKPMVFPPDDALANAGTAMPAGENHAKWLGECARRFADALSGSGERWAA